MSTSERETRHRKYHMKSLRRYNIEDADYFVTIVTYNREQILHFDINLFWQSWDLIRPKAWVVLPDLCHILINCGKFSISELIHKFKIKYSRLFRNKFRPGRVLQNRFWDHFIRDQDDYNDHLDYIHYNPVKHNHANDPFAYQYSSLCEYHNNGFYERGWGVEKEIKFNGEFGE